MLIDPCNGQLISGCDFKNLVNIFLCNTEFCLFTGCYDLLMMSRTNARVKTHCTLAARIQGTV